MPDLSYSKDALDVLQYFHRRRFVVFVEGQEDVPFWREVFRLGGIADTYFKVAGGVEEIEKYVRAIVDEQADVFVARDSDLTELTGGRISHPRVMYTYGYAIENSLASEPAVAALVRIHTFANDDPEGEVAEWMNQLDDGFRRLIALDATCRAIGSAVAVPLDNAFRYLERRTGFVVPERTAAAANGVEAKLEGAAAGNLATVLAVMTKRPRYYIRGHCLMSAVMHFLGSRAYSATGKKLHMSADALYGSLVASLRQHLPSSDEWRHYRESLESLSASS